MYFTREPIIETIISPKEGCKLLVRSSRGLQGAEEYYVDAIEVVSFGKGFFFRSLERPKAFLIPVSDYEVLEVKETRVALKTPSSDRQNIKIGGGREAPMRQTPKEEDREEEEEENSESSGAAPAESESGPSGDAFRSDRRRDRRRRRHRRPDEQDRPAPNRPLTEQRVQSSESPSLEEEVKAAPQVMPTLLPPPSTLISQTMSRYKPKVEESAPIVSEKKEEPPREEDSSAEGSSLQRAASRVEDPLSIPTYFSSVESDRDFYSF